MPLSPGQIISQRYKVIRTLGQGGYGAVYLVEDTRLTGRTVALKESFDNSREAQQQFQFEAWILARLTHAALPRVSDYFIEPSGNQFLVMDYVEGQDLSEIIKRGAVPEQQAVAWMLEICDAVAFLHSQNPPIIHRDIKPHNIKVRGDGHAVLVDFGIAKLYHPQKRTARIAKAISSGFSPPEQYGGTTDTRSDVYALGATLYCAVTCCVPPEAIDLLDGTAQLPSPCQINSRLSQMLAQIILQAMALNSQQRFPTAREMAQSLQACVRGQPIVSVPVVPPVPVGAGVRCPTCGGMNRPGARFCKFDRTPLAAAPPIMPIAPSITPQMRFEAGNRLLHKKDYARAVAEYSAAARGGFEHAALYYNWAGACIELKRLDEAIAILQHGLARYSQDADLYAQLGLAYALNGQAAQAALVLKRAVDLNPQQPETHFFLGLVYQEMQQDTQAISEIRKFLASNDESAFAHLTLAKSLLRSDQLTQAQAEFQRVLDLEPQSVEAHLFMVVVHHHSKRYSDAVKWAQKTIRLDPSSSLAYYCMGQAHIEMSKWSDALKAFEESARLNPDDPDPHLQMAVCYHRMNRRLDARRAAERARQIDPNNQAAQDLLRKL